jgi:hypothetical protein
MEMTKFYNQKRRSADFRRNRDQKKVHLEHAALKILHKENQYLTK